MVVLYQSYLAITDCPPIIQSAFVDQLQKNTLWNLKNQTDYETITIFLQFSEDPI